MTDLKLADFESRLRVRPMRVDDYEALVTLQVKCFAGEPPWTLAHVESMIAHFPQGQICIELDEELVASSCSLIVDFGDYDDWHSWREIADDGFIRNHDPDGDTLYGIEIMVDPELRGYRLSRRLYGARKALARDLNLRRIIVGGRIPGYSPSPSRAAAVVTPTAA
jgi:hypothetical protein